MKRFKRKPVWFHCSSLGEFNAVKNIVSLLKSRYNEIFITTLTDTGLKAASEFLGKENVTILPLDFNFLIRNFIKKLDPKVLVIEETEVWPNLIFQAGKGNIPVIYTNCIISPKSFALYNTFRSIFRRVLEQIHIFFIQNKRTGDFLKRLGVSSGKIRYVGNIKFDLKLILNQSPNSIKNDLHLDKKAKILTAGSTRKGEERILLKAFLKLKEKYGNLKLVIVPRHLNRVPEIRDILRSYKIKYKLYGKIKDDYDVLLINKMGVLLDMYLISDIAFIGGTMVPIGGHNPIEAAYCKKPMISGGSIANNREAFEKIINNKGGFLVHNEAELINRIDHLLKNPGIMKKTGENAYKVIKENQGASKKIVQFILKDIS
ncbi:MAG: glycosyltransferase [Spirochaetes bacterium]|nr:glycosyltransferase [Spirochaetota bacterium]